MKAAYSKGRALVAGLAFAVAGTAFSTFGAATELAPVTPARLERGTAAMSDWLHYGGDYAGWRYSPLADIRRDNVERLAPVWMFQAGVQGQVATSPVVADGILYFTVAYNNLYALDAVSGRTLWHYEHPLPSDLRLCCGPANRGVAIAGSKVYMATLDAHLVAVDRASGKVAWNVTMDDYQAGYSATSAPLVVGDMVLVGSGGGEYGIRGFIDAYDLNTGERRWRRYTVPAAGEPGVESWAGESWKTGGAPAWMTGAYDPASKLLYWTTGNPAPLFNGDLRAGDNLYSDSVLALDAANGEIRWHFQYTPHDVWDYDATNGVILIDSTHEGKAVRALVQPNRNGYVYVLDAATGRFLRGSQYVERLNWSTGLDAAGRPMVDKRFYPGTEETPPLVCPGPLGGNNGSFSYAYSPDTRLIYVPTIESCLGVTKEIIPFTAGEANFGGSLGDGEAGLGKS